MGAVAAARFAQHDSCTGASSHAPQPHFHAVRARHAACSLLPQEAIMSIKKTIVAGTLFLAALGSIASIQGVSWATGPTTLVAPGTTTYTCPAQIPNMQANVVQGGVTWVRVDSGGTASSISVLPFQGSTGPMTRIECRYRTGTRPDGSAILVERDVSTFLDGTPRCTQTGPLSVACTPMVAATR
jgi:hypothetical protein